MWMARRLPRTIVSLGSASDLRVILVCMRCNLRSIFFSKALVMVAPMHTLRCTPESCMHWRPVELAAGIAVMSAAKAVVAVRSSVPAAAAMDNFFIRKKGERENAEIVARKHAKSEIDVFRPYF
jgi:hypothetical protein